MNEQLRLVAVFVRDLLSLTEDEIEIGRANDIITNNGETIVGVDSLLDSVPVASSKNFDDVAEEEQITVKSRLTVTLSFLGDNAYYLKKQYQLMSVSQHALNLQEKMGIECLKPFRSTDVKLLTGNQFRNRIDLSFNLLYNDSIKIATYRIDNPIFTVLVNN